MLHQVSVGPQFLAVGCGLWGLVSRDHPSGQCPLPKLLLRHVRTVSFGIRRGARIIIGEFFERAARVTMCEAYKQGMTQRQGYVWFLPGWYHANWYDVDSLR